MKVYVIVHQYRDQEEHCDFINVTLDELEAYKQCNSLNQIDKVGIYDVVVKECKGKQ